MDDLFSRAQKPFGTEPKKLVRRSDPTTSIEAACAVKSGSLEELVFNAIKSFGEHGCIGDDIHERLAPIGIQTISPRYKKLIDKGLIIDTGEKRVAKSGIRQRVLRAIE